MIFTSELENIFENIIDGDIKCRKFISSSPGTGKTTCIRHVCAKYSYLKILYLSYNVSNVMSSNMPKNVCCMSFHKLAYSIVGHHYKDKLVDNLSLASIKNEFNIRWRDAGYVKETLENWFGSYDDFITGEHSTILKESKREKIVNLARICWNKMKDLHNQFPMTHDGYLKGMCLGQIDLSKYFDVLIIDESQDITACFRQFIDKQSQCEVVEVGDNEQQIYRYKGTQSIYQSSHTVPKLKEFTLSGSFRFGPCIANAANSYLSLLNSTDSITGLANESINPVSIAENHTLDDSVICYLARKYITVIEKSIELLSNGHAIYWIGGVNSYHFNYIYDVLHLKSDNRSKIQSKELKKNFDSYGEYLSAAKSTSDNDMLRVINLINKYGDSLSDKLRELEYRATESLIESTVVIGTAHKSKGSEFEIVCLLPDFPEIDKVLQLDLNERNDELRLQFVAITRAMKKLLLPKYLYDKVYI